MIKPRHSTQVLDEIAQQQTRNDVDLSSRIITRVRKDKARAMKSKYVLSGVLAVMAIIVILFSIPSVATAMKRLLGYIPGAGVVENNAPLRILNEPVQSKQTGTTITIKQGVVDTQHTILVYQVENIPASQINPEMQPLDMCHQLPVLLLPDGSRLQGEIESGTSWVSGYGRRIVFPALPVDVNSIKLVFSCLEQTTLAVNTQKWEIALEFVKAPADLKVYPLVDLPTPMPAPTQQKTEEFAYASDLRLVVNRYVQTNENIVVFGVLESQSGKTKIEMMDSAAIHLRDASGNEVPLVDDPSLIDPSAANPNNANFQWAYHTEGSYTPGQATLTVDSAWIILNEAVRFTFDPGTDPQPNQKWTLNQKVEVAGREITIQDVQMNENGNGIFFTLVTPPDVNGITLVDPDHALLGGGGGQGSCGFSYKDGFPAGKINVEITSLSLTIQGPWTTNVELPALENTALRADTAEACLTASSWKTALENPAPIPDGLGGQLAIYGLLELDHNYHVMTAHLDGTNLQVLDTGFGITSSPDGKRFIYNGDAGLQMIDPGSGVSTPLQDNGKNDSGVLWSPDGTKIAFTRGPDSGLIGAPGPYSLFIANPDGTQRTPLLVNTDANIAQAWMPDGQNLVYTVKGPDGASVRSIYVSTGKVTSLFQSNYTEATVAVSPDGKQVAYEAMLPGDHYSIFVAALDGSNPKLIVDASPIVVTIPYWSPDGKWIVASVHDESFAKYAVLTLVNVKTCQIVPLKSLSGYVSAWIP